MVQRVKDPSRAVPAGAWVAAVARIRSPAWELPHGTGVPERKKEGKKERKPVGRARTYTKLQVIGWGTRWVKARFGIS